MSSFSQLDLAHWRREVAELYAEIRALWATDQERAHMKFLEKRDRLFKSHPASPLSESQQQSFKNLNYYSYDPSFSTLGNIQHIESEDGLEIQLPEGLFKYKQIAHLDFELNNQQHQLTLYWVLGYGGGLFLPFKDATSNVDTYGGGRYLYDGIKGADLGMFENKLILDFNFAYNPSCSYNERWVCPLATRDNSLDVKIEAGEKHLNL